MRVPKSFYNWLSVTGFILAVNSLLLIFILFIFSITSKASDYYLGIYIYLILPMFLVLGLILIPVGMIVKSRKKETDPEKNKRWPILDMNQKLHRSALMKVSIITFLFFIISAMGSYQAFNYTESVEFCGELCHSVMSPEHTTYLNSSHARVPCVDCHVGEGASWYMKSKLSGMYQVYSVLFHKYSKPIETPILSLRPARETCERCHWPQKFYSRKLRNELGYLSDSLNTEWNISLLMKIGPENGAFGLKEGIHWHINPDTKIEYISNSRDRESIPWVKFTNIKTGVATIFEDEENKLDKKAMDTLQTRTMDCMDCHNRPSHLYKSAMVYVDNAMITGQIPNQLPFVKKAAMETLKNPFGSADSAMRYIQENMLNYYKANYPQLLASKTPLIHKAIDGMKQQYSLNAFPQMKADASKYLNHIGHLESNGCFRCHDNKHKAANGKIISKDCNLCHTIIAQGPKGKMEYAPLNQTLEFKHPVDIGDAWNTGLCSECHKTLYQ